MNNEPTTKPRAEGHFLPTKEDFPENQIGEFYKTDKETFEYFSKNGTISPKNSRFNRSSSR